MKGLGVVGSISGALVIAGLFATSVSAYRFSSTNYVIDASVAGNSMGGSQGSTSYNLTGSGGESVVGNGSGGSYKVGMGYVSQLPRSLALTIQPSGLLAHYTMDEPSGTRLYDQSASLLNADMIAGPTPGAGKLAGGYTFDGATQYATIGTTSSLPGTEYTLQAWVKTSVGNATMAVVTKASNFWLGINFGKVAVYDWTAPATCTAPTPTASDNAWHHIAATLKSGAASGSVIYVDGIQQKTCTWTPVAQNGLSSIGAAKAASWQQFFNGTIDYVKVYGRAMSADEIKAEYDAQNGGVASGLSLGTIVPGASNTILSDVVVQTNAPGYMLAVNQNHDLTSGSYTISAISSGTIAAPAVWTEGTTKGLGFTLSGTNASAISGVWGGGNNYAAFPNTATTFYTRTNQPSSPDYVTMRLRADVASSQVAATTPYTNLLTITGTMTP